MGGGHMGGGMGGGHMGGGWGGGHMGGGWGGGGMGYHHPGGGYYGGYGGGGGAYFYPGFLGGIGLGGLYGLGYGYGFGYGPGYGLGSFGYGNGYGSGGYYPSSYYPYSWNYGYGNGYNPYSYTTSYPVGSYAPGYIYPTQSAPSGVVGVQSTVPVTLTAVPQGKLLGIDEVAVKDSEGQGMRVDKVYPGSAAEQAGLKVGDVIHQANGYLTQVHGNLTWIINHHAGNGVLNLSVHRAASNRDTVVVAKLR